LFCFWRRIAVHAQGHAETNLQGISPALKCLLMPPGLSHPVNKGRSVSYVVIGTASIVKVLQ
jgi:hypothetical protein